MTVQLDLFKDQRVPSYGAAFAKQRGMDDPDVRDMLAVCNDARDRMMASPEFKALQAQWKRDREAQADDLVPDAMPTESSVPLDVFDAMAATYSADKIANAKHSPLRAVYDYAGERWVNIGGAWHGERQETDYIGMYRVVPDPEQTGFKYGSGKWRGYDGMAATLRGQPVKLVGPEWKVHPDLSARSTLL